MEETSFDESTLKGCLEKFKRRRVEEKRKKIREELKIAEVNKDITRMRELILKYKKLKEGING